MTFASGALPADTLITLAQFSPNQAPSAPARQHLLTAIEVSANARAFGAPVTITLPYNPADLGGAHPDTLQVWVYEDAAWRPIGGTTDELVGSTSVTTPFGSPAFDDRGTPSTFALMAPANANAVGGVAEAPSLGAVSQEPHDPHFGWIFVAAAALAALVGVLWLRAMRRRSRA